MHIHSKGHKHTYAHTHSLDRAGILLSAACLVHCTVLPLALAALQVLGVNLFPKSDHDHIFHLVFAFILLGVGGYAFGRGYRKHQRALPLFLGIFGTGLLFLGALNPGEYLSELQEHGITVVGTIVLIGAHILNRAPAYASEHA